MAQTHDLEGGIRALACLDPLDEAEKSPRVCLGNTTVAHSPLALGQGLNLDVPRRQRRTSRAVPAEL